MTAPTGTRMMNSKPPISAAAPVGVPFASVGALKKSDMPSTVKHGKCPRQDEHLSPEPTVVLALRRGPERRNEGENAHGDHRHRDHDPA